jgi:hypothetical protein
MEIVCICGARAEVIEVFEYHILVQDIDTLDIFTVEISQIDSDAEPAYSDKTESNVVSLKGRTEWLRTKAKREQIKKARVRQKASQPRSQPKSKLLHLRRLP